MKAVGATVRFLAKPVSWRIAAAAIIGLVTLVSALAVPYKATIDGILYIASAKSLFNSNFGANYAWFREPGYPVFLRIIHFFGDDGLFVIIVQAACLGLAMLIALYAVRQVLGKGTPTIGSLALTIVLVLNPMFLIYSALVLQQALFTLQLALFVLGVVLAFTRPAWLRRWLLVTLVVLNYFLSIWTSIGWIYLALFPVALTIVAVFWPSLAPVFARSAKRAYRVTIAALTLVAIVALTSLVYFAGVNVYSGWQSIKAPHLQHLTIPGAVIEPLSAAPRIPTVVEMANRMMALTHILPADGYPSENDLFMWQQMMPGLAAGQYDTAYVHEPYTSYAAGWFTVPDASNAIHFAYARTADRLAPIGYDGSFIVFVLVFVLAAIRRRWKLLMLLAVPLSFLFVYALSNSPVDRYGVPAYPWAAASVIVLVSWLREVIVLRRQRLVGGLNPSTSGESL